MPMLYLLEDYPPINVSSSKQEFLQWGNNFFAVILFLAKQFDEPIK